MGVETHPHTNTMNINSQQYWDKNMARPEYGIRQQFFFDHSGRGERIAELGCGVSPFLNKALEKFSEAWGIDFSPKTCEVASKTFPEVKYLMGSALDTGFPNKYFDTVVSGELIEHMDEPLKLLKEMNRLAKRRLIISTSQMEYPEKEHIHEFTKAELLKLFKPYGKTTVTEFDSKWFPGRKYLFVICQKSLKPKPNRKLKQK